VPEQALFVLAHFFKLSDRRNYTDNGPLPISWEAMKAYQDVAGLRLEPWALAAIDRLDKVFLKVWFESQK